jgi:propanediol utilization protein
MQTLFASLISFVLLVQTAGAAGRVVTLVLPRSLNADEAAVVELKLGVIQRGTEVEVETTSGKMLGVISPYGIRSGSEAGTYTVPVPPEEFSNKRISLRITLNQHSRGKRAPNSKEVQSVRLKITSSVN